MCNPSSNAERTRATDTAATDWAQRYSHDLIHQAYAVGPATAWFIDQLWKQAAQEAYWQSLEVLQFARWCSAQRLERAISRIFRRGDGGFSLLRFILEQELDLLEDLDNADLKGQLLFPFITRELTEADRQSGNQHQSAGFPRTSSRYSP